MDFSVAITAGWVPDSRGCRVYPQLVPGRYEAHTEHFKTRSFIGTRQECV
jgi:hypothetical protein